MVLGKSSCVNSKHLQNQLLPEVELPIFTVLVGTVAQPQKAYSMWKPLEWRTWRSHETHPTLQNHPAVCLSAVVLVSYIMFLPKHYSMLDILFPKDLAKGVSDIRWENEDVTHHISGSRNRFLEVPWYIPMKSWWSSHILPIFDKTPSTLGPQADLCESPPGHHVDMLPRATKVWVWPLGTTRELDELPGWSGVEHRPAGPVLGSGLKHIMEIRRWMTSGFCHS